MPTNAKTRETLISLLDDCLARRQATAFAERRGLRVVRWSYAQLAQTAFQFARELEARKIERGDRVLFWAENGAAWVAAFFGCLLRGVVVVPLDEHSAPDFAGRVQEQVAAKLLLAGAAQQKHLINELPSLRLDELSAAINHHSSATYQAANISSADLAEIIFTSGTTAEPKGVCLTHGNLLANLTPLETEINKYRRYERPFHPLRFLCLLPLSHVFGQFMGLFVPQLLGGEVFFQSSLNPAEIMTTIKRERISVVAAVPRQLATLRDKIERDYAAQGHREKFERRFARAAGKHFLQRWWLFRDVHARFGWKFWAFVAGGATLAEETEEFWQRLGFAVVQGYGMTETASLIAVNHPFKLSRGSLGKTLPGQEVKLGTGGEILVRGANVAAGYWPHSAREQASPLAADEGWLRTGDIGQMDAAGNLFFKGRQKEVIVTAAGLNIFPEDLEAALDRQPEVRASCVVGVDGAQGPEPLAALILRDEKVNPAAVVRRANALLNPAQQVRRWFIWTEADFPRTATQKVRKQLVKETVLAQAGNATSTQPANAPHNQLAALVAAAGATDLHQLDSLGRVALLSALEDCYQIELDEAALTPTTTLAELERMITSRPAAPMPPVARSYPYPRWARRWPVTWLRFLAYYLLIAPFVAAMCWPRVRGREQLREWRGPVLLIANHISMVDAGLILFALPRQYRHRLAVAMGGERLRQLRQGLEGQTLLGRLVDRAKYMLVAAIFNVFALPQMSGFRRSFAYAGAAVDDGYSLLVFPEGRTTTDGQMNPFMSGIGLLAEQLNVPVVPIKITGLFDLTVARRYFSRPGTVAVTFGAPIEFARGADPARITAELEMQVQRL